MMVKENQLKERVKQQPPQQAAPQTQSAPKKAAGKKSRGKLVLGGVLFLFAAAALTLGVLALTANLFGGRDAAINYLISMDPEYLTAAEIRADLELREADLAKREQAAEQKEEKLAADEARQKAETERQDNSTFEGYIANLSEERLNQLKQVSSIYSGMDAELAAAALAELGSVDDMAVVVFHMKSESASGLMNCLDAETAARITERILG